MLIDIEATYISTLALHCSGRSLSTWRGRREARQGVERPDKERQVEVMQGLPRIDEVRRGKNRKAGSEIRKDKANQVVRFEGQFQARRRKAWRGIYTCVAMASMAWLTNY